MNRPFVFNEPLNPRLHQAMLARTNLIDTLCQFIEEREYCLVLGPKYSGRTTLLKATAERKQVQNGYASIHVRPFDLTLTDEARFFDSLAKLIEREIRDLGDGLWPGEIDSSRYSIGRNPDAFNALFDELVQQLPICLVLFFDGIERIPPNILTRLAHIAHAIYQTRTIKPLLRNVCFVFAGSISLRYLTFQQRPELSPFNICRDIILSDLSAAEARKYLEKTNEYFKLNLSYDSISTIVEYVGGDLNMLQRVTALALQRTKRGHDVDRLIIEAVVKSVTEVSGTHGEESLWYSSMLVEEDPPTLELVLNLLRGTRCRYQPSESDRALYDAFKITYPEMAGALILERDDGVPISWLFRNRLTHMFFQQHFTPQRIVKTYSALGEFEKAVHHCDALLDIVRSEFEGNVVGFDDSDLKDVLIAFTNRIYEAGSHEFAYELLALLLKKGFGCPLATYYDYVPTQRKLKAVEFLSHVFSNDGTEFDVEAESVKGVLEIRALHAQLFAIESEGPDALKIAIPLMNLDGEVTAVVTLHTRTQEDRWASWNLKIQIIQRALGVINLALNKVELDHKSKISDSVRLMKPGGQPITIFVAHKFSGELLTNLREHLGRVSDLFSFQYVDESHRVGALYKAIEEQIRSASFCLYEVTHVNSNVYFELGLGLGLNKAGLMFAREAKGIESPIPPLMKGIFRFAYADYKSLLEELVSRVEGLLKQYLLHQSGSEYLHFLGVETPRMERKIRYAVVLDHDHFGDQADYRQAINNGLQDQHLKIVYPMGPDVFADDVLTSTTERPGVQWLLVDWLGWITHADVVVCRIEKIDDCIAAQTFIGLGMAMGLSHNRVLMTHLLHDFRGEAVKIPADLEGIRCLKYDTLIQLTSLVSRGVANMKSGSA